MPRIVIVLTDPPLPFGLAAARWSYVLVRGLTDRGHRVTTFAVCGDPAQAAQVADLFPAPRYDVRLDPPPLRRGLRAKLETWRRPSSYVFGPDLRRALRAELARGFDVLHLEQTWSGWLGLDHVARAVLNVHNLYAIDLAARPPATLHDRLRRAAVLRAERMLLRRYRQITTLTPRLTAEVGRISPGASVHTVPLGIDLALYPFEESPTPSPLPRPPVVGLVGSFGWEPTRSAGERLLTRLWPVLRAQVPGVRLRLVGRSARAALGHLARSPDIDMFEDVPDIIPHFRALDVMVYAPGPASGMKVKVLEALALGVPVVTNADGVEGLPAVDGLDAGLAEDDAGLIARAVALLSDPARRIAQRRAARALLEAHCRPELVLDRLEQVYATLPAIVTERPWRG